MSTSAASEPGPVERSIREKLTGALNPASLTITNDSWRHRHHAAMRDQNGGSGETHFTLNIVSNEFKGKTSMQRHRMIYSLLNEEFASGLHALSLHTKTEEEIQAKSAN
ncbi:hypothetical protein CC1G_01988 [Coprinopsis cinerea okayama7|uniref:Bola-like protein n=1 Tax=Coprinopsis cinerea (strain Okayama-7 / 130 / ATCC MYA-4618 / FGSC 9003) TaxID=240176 RepID=A8N676_COPC7|nr:hypothetical protein CC1G_01988 [Coprinopsis cinerea okayama7\|eukprot:XP_001830352.2 hypothetical protein CC1G_01988 [Coprinopsis cinerea okayama7\